MADAATIAALSEAYKTYFLPGVREQLNNEIGVFQLLDLGSTDTIVGLEAKLALHTGRSKGIGARNEFDDLPKAGSQKYKNLVYDLTSHYGIIAVSGQAIQKSATDAGAWIRAMSSETERIRDDLMLDFARQAYGTGDGVIAVVDSVNAGAGPGGSDEVVLTSAEPLSKGYLYPGMEVDFSATVSGDDDEGTEIIDIDETVPAIYVASGTNATAADFVSRTLNLNSDLSPKEMDAGLQKLIADDPTTGVVGGLDRANNTFWRNQFLDASGTLTLSKLMKTFNVVKAKGAKAQNILALTSDGVARVLFESADFQDSVRFVNTETLTGGFEAIKFAAGSGSLTLTTDRLAPWGKVYFVDKGHIKLYSPADWDLLARDGQPVKWVQNKDAYQSILYRYANLGTDRSNTSAVIFGITDDGF